jgi:uncharacterized protein YidB (DUF937 family)
MDSLKGAAESGSQTAGTMQAVTQLLNQSGGIQGLIQSFEQHGLGHVIGSWTSTGPNLPIEPNQLQNVLGADRVSDLSQKTGLPQNDLLQKLVHFLPLIVDRLTPDGQVKPDQFSGSNLLSLGKSLLH